MAEGQLDKMSVLFDKYHLNVFNFYLQRGHSRVLCEDLTQDVFERILRYRASYKSSLPFRAWLFRISRNVEADIFKKKKIKISEDTTVDELELLTENVLTEIEKKEEVTKLKQALSYLSTEEQELLHFSKFQNMKYADISKILNISESSVKVKIHRAIKKLRVNYQKIEVL